MANNPLAALLQETAKQPDVAYIALVNGSSKVLITLEQLNSEQCCLSMIF